MHTNGHTPAIVTPLPLPAPAPITDQGGALLDELDSLIGELGEAMLARDVARDTLAERERKLTLIQQRILLVRHSLSLLAQP